MRILALVLALLPALALAQGAPNSSISNFPVANGLSGAEQIPMDQPGWSGCPAGFGNGSVCTVRASLSQIVSFVTVPPVQISPSTPTTISLSGDTFLAAGNYRSYVDPSVVFVGGLYRSDNLFPFIPKPIYTTEAISMTYGSAYASYHNTFVIAANAIVANATSNTVALFGQAVTTVTGANGWGANTSCVAMIPGAPCISIEVDSDAYVSGATSYGVVVVGAGYYPSFSALQVQAASTASNFNYGVYFNSTGTSQAVNTALVFSTPNTNVPYGMLLNGTYGQSTGGGGAEWKSPSFVVAQTPGWPTIQSSGAITPVEIVASLTGNPAIEPLCSGNCNLALKIPGSNSGSIQMVGKLYLGAVTGGNTAANYVCTDSASNVVVQSGAC